MEAEWESMAAYMGYGDDREMLEDMYVKKALSQHDIARRLGMSVTAISHRMKYFGIDARGKGGYQAFPKKKFMIHLLDQRLVFGRGNSYIGTLLNINPAYVWKYKRGVKGDRHDLQAILPSGRQAPELDG